MKTQVRHFLIRIEAAFSAVILLLALFDLLVSSVRFFAMTPIKVLLLIYCIVSLITACYKVSDDRKRERIRIRKQIAMRKR